MAKRITTKIGDIFSVELDNGNKKYYSNYGLLDK
ncbi:hypothetical protein SAMN05216273_11489 [Chryseobacterium taihuense]|uniref:Uncharacterized protein n=1 Tax=Chryseobacterium taihuense TaxID=1141221 RepID=A0ABY0QZ85_9FLAO|nr:hypothetical protein SAMN05216273_11489 [Chryseobacterium taihuense]